MQKFKTNYKTITILAFYLSSLVISPTPCYAKDSVPLSQRVVSFGRSRIGQTVNNGNCWVFVRDALAQSGAKFPGRGGQYPVRVFGRQISSNELRPGDIIYFQSAVFAFRGRVYAWTGPEHYAIIESRRYATVQILHQNWAGKRYVIRGQVDLNNLISGRLIFFRPQTR